MSAVPLTPGVPLKSGRFFRNSVGALLISLALGWGIAHFTLRSGREVAPQSGLTGPKQSRSFDADWAGALTEARLSARLLTAAEQSIEENRGVEVFAANPANAYTASFAEKGVRLMSSGEESWQMWFQPAHLLGSGAVPARPRIHAERQSLVEYDRGIFTEWFHNRPTGLEHGLILHQSVGAAVEVRVPVEGFKLVRIGDDEIALRDENDRGVLRYRGLKAWDATGRPLSGRMSVVENSIALHVALDDAAYPVTIDPEIVAYEQKLHGAIEANHQDYFGISVAISGDACAVGVPGDDGASMPDVGAVYVFRRTGTVWHFESRLALSNGAAGDRFGRSVAMQAEVIAVGAPFSDSLTPDGGRVYVFQKGASGWSSPVALSPTDVAPQDQFGISVALFGNQLLAGSFGDDVNAAMDAGSVHSFTGSGLAWGGATKWTAPVPAHDDRFGFSVAISGDTAVVGAFKRDVASPASAVDAGCGYVFTRANSMWSFQSQLTAPEPMSYERVGFCVSVSGDTVFLGAPALFGTGSVYVFERSGQSWSHVAKLAPLAGTVGDSFGQAVGLLGNVAVVGAPGDDHAFTNAGAAYVFDRVAGQWTQFSRLSAPDAAAGDAFGIAVALAEDRALIGSYLDDGGHTDMGSAHLYRLKCVPELVVSSAGAHLRDGATLHFPTVFANGSHVLAVTLRNNGCETLHGLALQRSGPQAGDFSHSALASSSLGPGAAQNFTITFAPLGNGYRSAEIQIASNDPNVPAFRIALRGFSLQDNTIESWREAFFNTRQNAGIAANDADPDGDSVANLLEFALHMDPTYPSSYAEQSFTVTEDRVFFTYSRNSTAVLNGIVFQLEVSDSLLPDSWQPVADPGTIVSDNGQVQQVRIVADGAANRRFFRLRVSSVSP